MFHSNRAYIEAVDADRTDRLAAAGRGRRVHEESDLHRLVHAASSGDTAAWSTLLERFTARLRAVARAHRLAVHDAEDVVQTTWLRLLEHIDSVKDPAAVGAWLETTARRESLRILRSAERERPTEDDQLDPQAVDASAERRLVGAENRDAIGRALQKLPARQQRLLSMLFAEPAPSYEQISETLGMPVGSLGPTRARGLARLRDDDELVAAIATAE